MTDYMKEAERLIEEYGNAEWKVGKMSEHSDDAEEIVTRENARAALLAHIQRGAVPGGDERGEWEAVVFTLMGHAASLYFCGQSDMPNWFYELAEKLARRHVDEALAARVREVGVQQRAMLAAAPAPDQFRDAAGMAPVHCTPTEHEGRIVYEHTSEPIPNADGFVLYAAPAPDRFRAAAKMMAVQPACMTCSGHGMVGGLLPNGGGYQADPCHDCAAPVTAGVPMLGPDFVPTPKPDTHCYDEDGERDVWSYSRDLLLHFGNAREAAGYARGLAEERERICAAIKQEDDYCCTYGDYMLDSDDCIRVARGEWVRPDFAKDAQKSGA